MVVTGIVGETLAFNQLKLRFKNIEWKILNDKNIKDYDLIGKNNSDEIIKIQVKTIKRGDWSLNMEKFLVFNKEKLRLNQPEQWVTGINLELKKKIDFFIFVYLNNFFEEKPIITNKEITIPFSQFKEDFYIIKTQVLQQLLKENYSKWLNEHNQKRPKNPLSYHSGPSVDDLKNYKDNWEILIGEKNENC